MIRMADVTFTYAGAPGAALAGVDLDVAEGELLLVAGASGSGKSTLLRTFNGLVPHFHGGRFSGRVTVDGADTLSSRPRDLAPHVGFVGQDPEVHAVVDRVEDDVAFTLENLGLDPATMRKRVEETLDALGIAALRRRRLDTLSGGERQRAAIASVLAAMPRHLVLDEPTSQLDPQSAEEVLSGVLRLRDEVGVGVALAEHRLERVLSHADRLCVMEDGRVDCGPPAGVLGRHGLGPPVARLGRALGWEPLPLGLRDALARVRNLPRRPVPLAEPPAAGDAVARAGGLVVTVGGGRALGPVDLTLRQGEVVALMGRNGSGKTTLLRALAGLVRGRGRVTAPGSLAYLPQNPSAVLFRRTVAEEVAATMRVRGLSAGATAVAAESERLGVADLLGRDPHELSGGQRTRAALAAVAAGSPALVLLDEPTRGMDEPGKDLLRALLHRFRVEGAAVVLATHDVELAARVATRVVLLAEGEVVLDGSPREALAASLTFSTQMNRIFGDPSVLTVEDALLALGARP